MRCKIYIIVFLLSIPSATSFAQTGGNPVQIAFRPASAVLYDRYADNGKELLEMSNTVAKYEDVILSGNGHIRIVANIPVAQNDNLIAINQGAVRAAVISNYLRGKFRFLTKWNFTFYVNPTNDHNDAIEVTYIDGPVAMSAPKGIYYTEDRNNAAAIKIEINKYGGIPYLSQAKTLEDNPMLGHTTNRKATETIAVTPVKGESNPKDVLIAIYYRWDKSNLDSLYLSNPQNLHLLDSILTSSNANHIDTLTIVAFASPEGNEKHNQDLSEWRAKTIKNYIISQYPQLPQSRIITEARGENWQGVLKFAEADSELPDREKVLGILRSDMSNAARQKALTALDGGATYYRYILPNYYRYLRNGASILITYTPEMPVEVIEPLKPEVKQEEPNIVAIEPIPQPTAIYPIALRTNLLYDAMGAINAGIEIPIKNKYSLIVDFAYSYWRSPKNLYALQTLEYGLEGRYWFGVSEQKKASNPNFAQALKGWNIGVYGRYWQRYDVQWIDGVQGDGTWSIGITGGYSFPINRSLALEASLGAGYLSTNEYRHYHQPEYDRKGDDHLMWQETGTWSGFTITKVRFSLVWLIQSQKRGGRKQ